MANIPENTTNPILRPVTRLETTTKVFGGEYIPDDEQQRGISNLQAIELAERDQYILSRVGQPYVPASGDIPAKDGIAGLDTSGRVPKTQLPTDTVYTEAEQTLKNKTIDFGNVTGANTLKMTPYSFTTDKTLTTAELAKEMSVVLGAQYICLTLQNAPYAGYRLPITSGFDCTYVKFTNVEGNTCVIAITSRQTVVLYSFGYDRWYLESGTTLTITSNNTITNAPIKDSSLDPSDPDYRYLPNDWRPLFSKGEFFFYYGTTYGVSRYELPVDNCVVSVNRVTNARGVAFAQRWNKASNENPDVPKLWANFLHDDSAPYEWQGWYQLTTNNGTQTLINKTISFADNTLTGVASTSTSQTLTNKTIASTNNTITFNATSIKTTQTVSPTKETSYLINPDSGTVVLTIDQMPYHGIRIPITCMANAQQYVIFKNWAGTWVCICMHSGDTLELCGLSTTSDNYTLSGANLSIRSNDEISQAPANTNPNPATPKFIPNDWKTFFGPSCSNTFMYSATDARTTYDIPTGWDIVTVHFGSSTYGTAELINYASSSALNGLQGFFYRDYAGSWDPSWSEAVTLNRTQTLTDKTLDTFYNTFISTPIPCRATQTITAINSSRTITIDTGSSSFTTYIIDTPTRNGFTITIFSSVSKDIQFKSYTDGQTTVTKTITPGYHHLYSQGSLGWAYVELSGTYTDNTTFTYLL